MLRARKSLKPEWYTPLSQANEPTPTKFLLQPLNGFDEMAIELKKEELTGRWLPTSASSRAIIAAGLKGWENFLDDNGAPLKYDEFDKDRNLEHLSIDLIYDLSSEIVARTRLTPEQRKNLLSPSTSQGNGANPSTATAAPGDVTATKLDPAPGGTGST